MSSKEHEGHGGSNIIKLDTFRNKREKPKNQPTISSTKKLDIPDALFNNKIINTLAGHSRETGCACIFCQKEKEGYPLSEITEKWVKLKSTQASGQYNKAQYTQWLIDLRKEDLQDIGNRINSLDERRKLTHPAYANAVIKVYSEKLIHTIIGPKTEDKK